MPWERDSSQYQTCSSMEQMRQWIYWFDLYEKNTLPLHFSGYLMNITKNYCVPSFPKYQGLRAAKNHVSTRSTKSQKTHPMSFLRTNMEMRLCLGYGLSQKTQKSKRRFCSTRPKSENIISKWQTNTIVWFFARRSFRNIFCRFLGLGVFWDILDIFRLCWLTSLIAEFGGSLGLFLGFSFMSAWDLGLVRPALWIQNIKQLK